MKKLFVVLSLVLGTSFVAFAQKPVAGAKGFTFGLNNPFGFAAPTNSLNNGPASRTGTLLFRYYLADDLAARVSLSYGKNGEKTIDTTTIGREIETKTSNSRFAIQLGVQKSFGESEKLEPYVFGDISFIKSGGKYFRRSEVVNTKGFEDVGDFEEVEANGQQTGGGYVGGATSFGVVPGVGFNYYFTENFAIGAEFSWGLILTTDDKNVEETTTQKAGPVTTTTKDWFNTTRKSTEFGSQGNGFITVSVFF